jgi:hypothetical protein
MHIGHPYYTGKQIDVYPILSEGDEDSKLTKDLTNLQIRSTLAIINPSGPGSPHHPRSIKLRTLSRAHRFSNPLDSSTMSTQTVSAITVEMSF